MKQFRMQYEKTERALVLYEDRTDNATVVFSIPDVEFVKPKMRSAIRSFELLGNIKQRGNKYVRFFADNADVTTAIKEIKVLLAAQKSKTVTALNEKIKESTPRGKYPVSGQLLGSSADVK